MNTIGSVGHIHPNIFELIAGSGGSMINDSGNISQSGADHDFDYLIAVHIKNSLARIVESGCSAIVGIVSDSAGRNGRDEYPNGGGRHIGNLQRSGSAVAKLGAIAGIFGNVKQIYEGFGNSDEVVGSIFEVNGHGFSGVDADIPSGRRHNAEFGNGGKVFSNGGNFAVAGFKYIKNILTGRSGICGTRKV